MSIFWIVFLLGQASVVLGATFSSRIKTETVHGKVVKFCEVKGLRMLPPSTFIDYDRCNNCTCTDTGLGCQTLSTAFRVTAIGKSSCVSVLIGCKNVWVRKNNRNQACPSWLIPTEIAMSGK